MLLMLILIPVVVRELFYLASCLRFLLADLDYLFGVYSGILFTSTGYFFIYSIITGNKPKVYPQVIFPGIVSGILWGIAMGRWSASYVAGFLAVMVCLLCI